MTSDIQQKVLENPIFGSDFTIFVKRGEPFFIGKEVGSTLGLKKPENFIANHVKPKNKMPLDEFLSDVSESVRSEILSKYHPKTNIINEPAFYFCCLKSSEPKLEPFQEWVCETLREIRKGEYSIGIENLSLEDNPVKQIQSTFPHIPDHSPDGDNGLRKDMHGAYGYGHHQTKNPGKVRGGTIGGKTTGERNKLYRQFVTNVYFEAKDVLEETENLF